MSSKQQTNNINNANQQLKYRLRSYDYEFEDEDIFNTSMYRR